MPEYAHRMEPTMYEATNYGSCSTVDTFVIHSNTEGTAKGVWDANKEDRLYTYLRVIYTMTLKYHG